MRNPINQLSCNQLFCFLPVQKPDSPRKCKVSIHIQQYTAIPKN